jgi:vitamin B12 transporter
MTRYSVFTALIVLTSARAVEVVNPEAPVELAPLTVYSRVVANQDSAGTFSMPVTALRYEPQVDVQARNFAEGQSDVAIRGGTFENTGFKIGALPIYDPQTGHYSAELPVAPAMLSAPSVRTGTDNALSGWGATAGTVAYGWQPVRSGGFASAGAGDNNLFRSDLYAGYKTDVKLAGRTLAADASVAHSESDGARSFGDHRFNRYNARVQLADATSQTDLFFGRQEKFTGWVNLYARANTPETDELETTLTALNHRAILGADGDYLQFGAYQRVNVDDYEYNRLIPGLFNPYQHTTYVYGTGLDGRVSADEALALRYRAGLIADDLNSTALTAGRYRTRSQYYAGLFPEYTLPVDAGSLLVFTAGANHDDSNRDGGRTSPAAELALVRKSAPLQRVYASYSSSSQLPTYTTTNSPAAGLFRGNPDIGRQTSQTLETGLSGSFAGWQTKAAVFYRSDNDLADWVYTSTASARDARPIDVDTTGVEFMSSRTAGSFDFVFGYAWLDKSYDYGAPGVIGSFYALNYAEQRLTAAVVVRIGAGLEARLDNEYRHQAENALRRGNDDPVLSSFGLYYTVPRVKGLSVFAQVDNLWNIYYEEVPLVPGAPREMSGGVRYAW